MPIPTRLISLNLGSQTIGLAEFRVQPHGGLVLLDYRLREISTDPTSEEMRRNVVERTMAHFGDIDILVNNAGMGFYSPAWNVPMPETRASRD